MPAFIEDIPSHYKSTIVMNGVNRGISESYNLIPCTWAAAVQITKQLAHWRAAILGKDMKVSYAVTSLVGSPKVSKVAIATPLPGALGVKYPTATYATNRGEINSPGVGLRMRMETPLGLHAIRLLRGVPDVWVKSFRLLSTIEDAPNLGTYSAVWDNTDANLPLQKVYPVDDTVTPTDIGLYKTWDEAFQIFLNCLFVNTTHKKITMPVGETSPTVVTTPWDKIVYRGLSERRAGRPSLR